MLSRWVAATDGSAVRDPGSSGWAWVLCKRSDLLISAWDAGSAGAKSSYHVELKAVVELLRHVHPLQPLEVRCDSKTVIEVAMYRRHVWRRNGWKKDNGEDIAEKQLVQELDALLEGRDVTFVWVKAHLARSVGDPLNYFVDRAARDAAEAGRFQ